MIDIVDLEEGTALDDIIDLLEKEEDGSYIIFVPKTTQRFFSSSEDIANDYAKAAFAGQKLKEISEEFDYDSVTPDEHESISFTIKGVEEEVLAETLLEISYHYVNEPEDAIATIDELNCFVEEVESGKIEAACPDFIDYYYEFVGDEEEREDKDNEEDEN